MYCLLTVGSDVACCARTRAHVVLLKRGDDFLVLCTDDEVPLIILWSVFRYVLLFLSLNIVQFLCFFLWSLLCLLNLDSRAHAIRCLVMFVSVANLQHVAWGSLLVRCSHLRHALLTQRPVLPHGGKAETQTFTGVTRWISLS